MPRYVGRRRRPVQPPGTHNPQVYQDTENALRELWQQAMRDAKERDYKWGPYNRGWLAPSASWADDFPPSPHTPPGAPPVPAPPGWGTYEPVGPGSDLAQMVRRLETIAPGIRGLSSDIVLGPDTDYMNQLYGLGHPELLGRGRQPLFPTAIRGNRDPESGNIFVSPFRRGSGLASTTAHELHHGTGERHPEAHVIGAVAEMLTGGLTGPPALRGHDPSIQEAVLSKLDALFGETPWYEGPSNIRRRRRP